MGDLPSSTITDETPDISSADTEKKPRSRSDLIVRLITGMVALPVIVTAIFLGGWFVFVPIAFLMLMGVLEFYFMERKRGAQNNALLGVTAASLVLAAFHFEQPILWQIAVVGTVIITFAIEYGRSKDLSDSLQRILTTIAGIFYIAFPMAFLVAIRAGEDGLHWFFAFIYCTWGTDTFAYFAGNMFGKTPLSPKLSPKKTIEGAVGGMVAGAILPLMVLYQGQIPITPSVILLFIVATISAVGADLFESAVKRFFGVKDSHIPGFNILPGHGGVLDRIDSTLGVATVMYIYLVMTGHLMLLI
ncbi:MAG: phosphatidate cytidylyltransferase [Chloroflexota bacterium]